MALLFTIPSNSYGPGTVTIPVRTIPATATRAMLVIDRTSWPDEAVQLAIALEVSYDNEATWLPGGGGTAQGGIARDRDGNTRTQTIFLWTWAPEQNGISRKARGILSITGGALITNGSVSVL